MEERSLMSTNLFLMQAEEALRKSKHAALRHLSLEEKDSSLIISGRVSSYYLKQLAQETIKPFSGPLVLVNCVIVGRKNTV